MISTLKLQFSTAIASMATRAPLLAKEGKAQAHSKASIFYGADEYLEELKRKYEHLEGYLELLFFGYYDSQETA